MSLDGVGIARRLIEEVWNNRKQDVVDELIAPSHRNIDANTPDLGPGPEGYKRLVALYTTAFPDGRLKLHDTVSEGDKVVMSWNFTGTHKGDLRGIAPTNKKISVDGITISRHANGKLVESRVNWDALGMMQQLGVVAAVGQAKGAAGSS
jgi:predicted ester cyclase